MQANTARSQQLNFPKIQKCLTNCTELDSVPANTVTARSQTPLRGVLPASILSLPLIRENVKHRQLTIPWVCYKNRTLHFLLTFLWASLSKMSTPIELTQRGVEFFEYLCEHKF